MCQAAGDNELAYARDVEEVCTDGSVGKYLVFNGFIGVVTGSVGTGSMVLEMSDRVRLYCLEMSLRASRVPKTPVSSKAPKRSAPNVRGIVVELTLGVFETPIWRFNYGF